MNRLEAPHGVLSRFFRARGLCGCTGRMREDGCSRVWARGQVAYGGLDYGERKADTHVYT